MMAAPDMIAHAKWTVSWFVVPRIHLAVIAVLSLLMGVLASAYIPVSPEIKDTGTNFAVGITFAETGVFGPTANSVGWHAREPFVPTVLAGYHLLRKAVGTAIGMDCVPRQAQDLPSCQELTAPYRHIQVAFVIGAAICVFLLVFRTTGNGAAAYVAYALTIASSALLENLTRLYTEAAAGALMALTALCLQALLARRRTWLAIALGASMAALVLTKIVFAYLWVIVILGLLALATLERRSSLRLFGLAAVVLCAYAVIVGGWMTRNYVQSGKFEIGEGRSYRVLAARVAYNNMRMDEYWAGYLYFLPSYGEHGLRKAGFDPSSYERFSFRNEDGFRSAGIKDAHAVYANFSKIKKAGGAPARGIGRSSEAASRHFRDAILADPVAHLRTAVLLAWGGLFTEQGFGFSGVAPDAVRTPQLWGMEMPPMRYRFTRMERTVFNIASALAVLLLPVVMWLRSRDVAGAIVAIPVLYSHGVYALASHFIPRYAQPEIPLRNAALCILAYLAISTLINVARSFRTRRGERVGGNPRKDGAQDVASPGLARA